MPQVNPKATLSADGGDEQFAGYYHYQWLKNRTIQSDPGIQPCLKIAKYLGIFNCLLEGSIQQWRHANHRFEKLLRVIVRIHQYKDGSHL